MLTLSGVVRAAMQIGGGVNKKTGEVIPTRSVVQVETQDARGLAQLHVLTVPDHTPYTGQIGERMSFPVRAWVPGGVSVNLTYDPR